MINITNKSNDTQNMNLIPSHMAFPCILRKIFLRDVAFCLIRCWILFFGQDLQDSRTYLSLPLLRTVSEMKISQKWCRFCHQMANCHEYSKQGEGENARETKNGRNVERRRWCLRCGEIMYPAVVVMLSETFFVRAEQVLIHNIFSRFKSMWLLGQICKSQVDP